MAQGVDPATGRRFTDPEALLRVFLQRQYSDPDEELLGLVGTGGPGPRVVRQSRDVPSALPLHLDRPALDAVAAAPESSGRIDRARGEVRWAKVPIETGGPASAFVVAFHADRRQAIADEAFRILLAISGVALLLTTGIGWVVAGRILAPVRVVRTTAAELTERDLTQRIPVQGKDDIAALAATFNAMLDRLERAFAGQRQFVDDAGHELRTPITIVRGHLELMGDDPAERAETVRLVTDELDRMSRIVEDLLLLAKAERPDFVRTEDVQLAELTADVFVKARALGDRDWVLDGVADREASLDAQRITQAMVQLAQNAVQHTVPGARIAIGSRTAAGRIELYVRRPGPRGPGAGRGGDLRALPTGHRPARRQHQRSRSGARHRPGHRRGAPGRLGRAPPDPGRRRHFRTCLRGVSIEPHPDRRGRGAHRLLRREGLRANGFTTSVAADGDTALALARTGAFDLVVLDIGLPGRDGFTVLRELREARVTLPVLVLTARDSVRDTVAGLEGGADDWMTKPFRFEELLARIRLRLRTAARAPEVTVLRSGDLGLDLRTRRARSGDRTVDLTAREFVLLELFLRHPGRCSPGSRSSPTCGGTTSTPAPTSWTSTSGRCGRSWARSGWRRCGAWGTRLP
ncbi:hypothetical protein Shyd_83640 [Streptomyces hydrogenans]|uniref:histidine kinase n=1 Tax=Streptomyces hydrogenans TaxID=1873719 RepID=A0ABQ3PPP5_9ACTN|nr:hypothetical protein Shyd_83640 [Streptomyces hydrogenans]